MKLCQMQPFSCQKSLLNEKVTSKPMNMVSIIYQNVLSNVWTCWIKFRCRYVEIINEFEI